MVDGCMGRVDKCNKIQTMYRISVSFCTHSGIDIHVVEVIQPKFMDPLNHNMKEKTCNASSLQGPCFIELENCYKDIQGDKFLVQFCSDIFARMCDSVEG